MDDWTAIFQTTFLSTAKSSSGCSFIFSDLEVEQPFDDLLCVSTGGRHLLLQRIPDKDQILQLRKLSHVLKLSPLLDQVVRHVEHLQFGQVPQRL